MMPRHCRAITVLFGFLGLMEAGPALAGPVLWPGWPREFIAGSSFFYRHLVAATDLNADGTAELCVAGPRDFYLLSLEGEPLPGWPKRNSNTFTRFKVPAFGDINGDGDLEVVVWTGSGSPAILYAWDYEGNDMPGFPIEFPEDVIGGGALGPTLYDLDGDGAMEIIRATEYNFSAPGLIYVHRGDGSVLPGWPQEADTTGGGGLFAVGDIDGAPGPEIVAGLNAQSRLFVFHPDGSMVAGWPIYKDHEMGWFGRVALADVDGDEDVEVIGNQSRLDPDYVRFCLWNGDATNVWPQPYEFDESSFFTNPGIANLDQQGMPEIIHPLFTRIWAFTAEADTLPYFPFQLPIYEGVYGGSPITGDIDGDGELEILETTNYAPPIPPDTTAMGFLYAYNMDGSLPEGWPLRVKGWTYSSDPVLADVDSDGTLDLFMFTQGVLGQKGWAYLFRLEGTSPPHLLEWPMLGHDPQRTCNYEFRPVVGIDDERRDGPIVPARRPALFQNFPNPFNPSTTIAFDVPISGKQETSVRLDIYDVRGRLVRTLVDEMRGPGRYKVLWDGQDNAGGNAGSGVYFSRIQADGFTLTRKLLLQR